ncbi:MAG: squalene--hopene cyclase, partial [Pirellulales bacterium]|nr:squalene--hopene cyclase [Pirellulales bacterium]
MKPTVNTPTIAPERLSAACETARCDLMAERDRGRWEGRLSSSALSTATAVSALVLAHGHDETNASGRLVDELYIEELDELILRALRWLADHQNDDGGWGDTDRSKSNIATTMLVRAAFQLTAVPADHAEAVTRADEYIEREGGVDAVKRRYGRDKTFAVPILTNCALAELVPWKEVSPLPFEMACLPQRFYRFLRLPVVSYAIPALVAIGQARYVHRKPWNPIMRLLRRRAMQPSYEKLVAMQPESGGFLEAIPLTSFVVMSLASIGKTDSDVVRRGIEFLLANARADGSWPIDSNLATWNTTLAVNALTAAGEPLEEQEETLDWLHSCQHRIQHPYTGADPGGWAWTDLSGGVPDADDTSGALLALANIRRSTHRATDVQRIDQAALAGLKWLLDLQNKDGGWPTFCRGWGKLPFDRSGADLTAHALRAFETWRRIFNPEKARSSLDRSVFAYLAPHIQAATDRGKEFLAEKQRADGSWLPLWFGNESEADEQNPVYGTSRVLMAYSGLHSLRDPRAQKAIRWLIESQNEDGGWGGGPDAEGHVVSSVEETSLATE